MSSTPGGAIGCTTAPVIAAPSVRDHVAVRVGEPRRRRRAPRCTPPTSVLCTSAGRDGFQRHRETDHRVRPRPPSSPNATLLVRTTGIPKSPSRPKVSRGRRPDRPVPSASAVVDPGAGALRRSALTAGTVPFGRRRHSPSQAARASARAADFGIVEGRHRGRPSTRAVSGGGSSRPSRHAATGTVRRRGRGAGDRRPRRRRRGSRRARRRRRSPRRPRPRRGASPSACSKTSAPAAAMRSTGFLHASGRGQVAQRVLELARELGHLEARRRHTHRRRRCRDRRRCSRPRPVVRPGPVGGRASDGHVEQLAERVDADDAGLAEDRVDRGVGVGQRGGVGTGAAGARGACGRSSARRSACGGASSRAMRANLRGLPNDSR